MVIMTTKAKLRYNSHMAEHKGTLGFFPKNCRFSCSGEHLTIDYWMEPGSKCPKSMNHEMRNYALFHYDLQQVCSHKVKINKVCCHNVNFCFGFENI